MASTPETSRSRRASPQQISAMIDFFMENPGLSEGKYHCVYRRIDFDGKWEEMKERLNNIGGSIKSVRQWQLVWRSLKMRATVHLRGRNKCRNRPFITNIIRRVIALIGSNYVEGFDSAVGNELDIDLEDGDQVIDTVSEEASEKRCDRPKSRRCGQYRNVIPKRKREEKDSDIQSQFLEIAQKQADALKTLAECSLANIRAANLMVEATISMAESIKLMGEGLKASAEAFSNLKNNGTALLIKTEVDDFVCQSK